MTQRLIAIDPGDVHNGIASFEQEADRSWRLHSSVTRQGEHAFNTWFEQEVQSPNLVQVVYEKFMLYPWIAKDQSFNEFQTCQRIGVIRYLCHRHGVPYKSEPALIKKPTFLILEAKGIPVRGEDQHQKDAQAHGWYWILNTSQR